MTVPCLLEAWSAHEAELLRYLRHHLRQPGEAEDLLHDLFLKALRQRERFCAVGNPRAWLFAVALACASEEGPAPVDLLSACLPRVLSELAAEDREAIERCDIGGMTQHAFAEFAGLSLPGAKSRVQRARQRLRAQLVRACQVQLDEHGKVCCFVPRPPL